MNVDPSLSTSNAGSNETKARAVLQSMPVAPDLVLRIGFAGNLVLPENIEHLTMSLAEVFSILATRLAEIAPGVPVGEVPRIARYYSQKLPTLRLVTGLAEGGDALAMDVMSKLANKHVQREFAAVLPCGVSAYRASRPPEFRNDFDKLAASCSYVLTLDGRLEAGDIARPFRARAYRAQSMALLRHADILVVALNPANEAKAGGTLETIHAALAFDLPVVFVHTINGSVHLLEPGSNVMAALTSNPEASSEVTWQTRLGEWVTSIVADPDALSGPVVPHNGGRKPALQDHGETLLDEFFNGGLVPPLQPNTTETPARHTSLRENLWARVVGWFRPKDAPNPISDPPLEPYVAYRQRATHLNYHYSGLYRGTFVLNYVLAVAAVALAAFSLVLLGKTRTEATEPLADVLQAHLLLAGNADRSSTASEPQATNTPPGNQVAETALTPPLANGRVAVTTPPKEHSVSPIFVVLLILGALKLTIVIFIFRNTHQANHGDWNDKSVDYRYLAERLRTLFYLPRVGGFQPPAAAPPQYASRVVRQSAVDWLFEAIVRSVPPAILSRTEVIPTEGGKTYTVRTIQPDVKGVLDDVRDKWLGGQIAYHSRNARTMSRLHAFAESWGKRMNVAVIIAVGLDVVILLADLLKLFPPAWSHNLHTATPWLVFLAALLPAAVASLNGIRFQSECRRLADRSAVVRTILGGRETDPQPGGRLRDAIRLTDQLNNAQKTGATNPGAWSVEVLNLSEKIASDLVQEVAEWSVLYAKEVVEP